MTEHVKQSRNTTGFFGLMPTPPSSEHTSQQDTRSSPVETYARSTLEAAELKQNHPVKPHDNEHNYIASASTIDQPNISLYKKLLHGLEQSKLSLAFPQSTEKKYRRYQEALFEKTTLVFIKVAIPVYFVFFLTDFLVFQAEFVGLAIMRAIVFGYICIALYLYIKKKLLKSMLTATLFGLVLCLLHVTFGSMLFESPYDVLYAAGVIPVFVYGITLLRVSFNHSMWFCLWFILSSAVAIGTSYLTHDLPNNIEAIYLAVTPVMFLFMVMIGGTGLFLSYAIDKLTRENWLHEQIATIESTQLANMAISLKQQAETDGLTGLYNRRFFDTALAKEWLKALKDEQPLSLAIIDVDWFKPYNDYYGHQQGDDALQRIATSMQRALANTSHLLTRYGGEEFFAVLPATPSTQAAHVTEKMRTAVQDLHIPHEKSPLGRCTLSIGLITVYPHTHDALSFDVNIRQALKRVDDALYQAKADGKNRVVQIIDRV